MKGAAKAECALQDVAQRACLDTCDERVDFVVGQHEQVDLGRAAADGKPRQATALPQRRRNVWSHTPCSQIPRGKLATPNTVRQEGRRQAKRRRRPALQRPSPLPRSWLHSTHYDGGAAKERGAHAQLCSVPHPSIP
eukprot:3207690-Pleurochrysis_carterae.AAC.3